MKNKFNIGDLLQDNLWNPPKLGYVHAIDIIDNKIVYWLSSLKPEHKLDNLHSAWGPVFEEQLELVTINYVDTKTNS